MNDVVGLEHCPLLAGDTTHDQLDIVGHTPLSSSLAAYRPEMGLF